MAGELDYVKNVIYLSRDDLPIIFGGIGGMIGLPYILPKKFGWFGTLAGLGAVAYGGFDAYTKVKDAMQYSRLIIGVTPTTIHPQIYINGELAGTAPLEKQLLPGDYEIVAMPVSGYTPQPPNPFDLTISGSGLTITHDFVYLED